MARKVQKWTDDEVAAVKARVRLSDEIGRDVALKKNGKEKRGLCPFHNEKTPSFDVNDSEGAYFCRGCGASGDIFTWLEHKGMTFPKAMEYLTGDNAPPPRPAPEPKKEEPPIVWPVGPTIDPPDFTLKGRNPSRVWEYKNGEGQLLFYIARYDTDAGKEIRPWILTRDGWLMKAAPTPRPMYGLEQLAMKPKAPVLIAEGEKACDALRTFFPEYAVVTWPGGASAIKHTTFNQLADRRVTIMPDFDEPGMKAAHGIRHKAVDAGAAQVRIIDWDNIPDDLDRKPDVKGWDAADALNQGWTREDMLALFKACVSDDLTPSSDPIEDEPEPVPDPGPDNVVDMHTREKAKPVQQIAGVINLDGTWATLEDALWQHRLILNEDMRPKARSIVNAHLYLKHHPDLAGRLRYDAFGDRIIWQSNPSWRAANHPELQDRDITTITRLLEMNGISGLNKNTVYDLVVEIAGDQPFDPVQEYLDALKWDGKKRVHMWLSYYLGADPTEYTELIGRRFMVGAVARALKPGCKFDTMLILEGRQGLMKSTTIRVLFDPWFTDELPSLDSKDASLALQGVWGVEMSELQAMRRTDANRIKEFLSHTSDRYRPPYGRSLVERPRRCVIVGTVNDVGGYLKDPTGARRFWPVACKAIDIDALQADRDQLWAEAVQLYRSGERWWLSREDEAIVVPEQKDRDEGHAWDEKIEEWLVGQTEVQPSGFLDWLGIQRDAWPRHYATVKGMLIQRGFKKKGVRINGRPVKVYAKDDED